MTMEHPGDSPPRQSRPAEAAGPVERAAPDVPPALRATDRDRDDAAALVQEAHADGRLDLDELDGRLSRIYASRTTQELATITADLEPVAHGSLTDKLVIRTKHSAVSRKGRWRVPPQIVVETQHAGVRLDFTEAIVRHHEILVEVQAHHGGVVMIVPPGWSVDVDELYGEHASVKNKAVEPRPGMPRLRATGSTRHAGVVVRHPRRRRWWWPFGSR